MTGKRNGQDGDTIYGGFVLKNCHTDKPTVEPPRVDELSPPAEDNPPHPRPWTKLPRVRRNKLALMAIGSDILNKGDPRYYRALRLANSYRKQRTSELANMHGHVSSGVSTFLANASMAWAASRFLYERFADTGEPGAGELDTLKTAAKMAADARSHELAAWEMAAREGILKKKQDASFNQMPWMASTEPEKKKAGRKTNKQRQEMVMDMPPVVHARGVTVDDITSDNLEEPDDA